MELDEFHVRDFGAGAPCHGEAVSGGDAGVGGVQINPSAAAGGQNDMIGSEGDDLASGFVEDVDTDAAVCADVAQFPEGDQINGHVIGQGLNPGGHPGRLHQCILDGAAGGVFGVKDAAHGVPPFMAQIELREAGGLRAPIKLDADFDQFADPAGAIGDDTADDGLVAESIAGLQSVLDVEFKGVLCAGYAGDPSLCVAGVGFVGSAFCDDGHRPKGGGLQGEA